MGRQNKWKIIMDLDVQDPKDMLTFSSKDLTWTEIYRHDSPLFDRVALIPSHRVSDFVKGEETNADAPCTFVCTVSKPPGRRGSASLRYELYNCSYGPEDKRRENAYKRRGLYAKKRGCQCHFIVKVLNQSPDIAILTYNMYEHEDEDGWPCHGKHDVAHETRSLYAPKLSRDIISYVESCFFMGVPIDNVCKMHINRHLDKDVEHRDRDFFLTMKDVVNIYNRMMMSDVFVGSALVDMYAKCGSIEDSYKLFHRMPVRNVVSWNTMIVGYAMHGHGKESLQLFEEMKLSGCNPDHITFLGVLSGCCHVGSVNDGWWYFNSMSQYYCIMPTMEHYSCMVDLLGHAGLLDDAQDFIKKMPVEPNATIWGSLLAACRAHINIELAENVAECLFKLDPNNAAPSVMLSNIYAVVGKWDHVHKVRKMIKDGRIEKTPGNAPEKVHFVGALAYFIQNDLSAQIQTPLSLFRTFLAGI